MTISSHPFWNTDIDRTWKSLLSQRFGSFEFSKSERPKTIAKSSIGERGQKSSVARFNVRFSLVSALATSIPHHRFLSARSSPHRSNYRFGQQVLISYFFSTLCARLDEEIERSNGLRSM
jgi:hypothetical protein